MGPGSPPSAASGTSAEFHGPRVTILIRAIEAVVIALMGTITVLVIGEVVLRGVAGTSLVITDELARYLMIWTAMLAATVLVHEDGHVRTTILPDALPPRAAAVVYLVADVITLCFLGAVIGSSLALMLAMGEQNTITLGVSMLWFYAALPVCAALMFLLTARAMIVRLARKPD
jgi:TRAP-type C4-dicarboxylate transport system permease small subunit